MTEGDGGREKAGTFVVAHADEETAVLRDVRDAEVHAVEGPGDLEDGANLEEGEVLEATLRTEPPIEAVWSLVEVDSRRTIPVERSPEAPTKLARDLAADQAVGEVTTRERAGEGELHVLTVPPGETETAADEVRTDPETVARVACLGVARVEIRAEDGVLSVRYLP